MWIGVGKIIQQGTRESHQNLSMEQQISSDCLKSNVLLSIWTNPGIACLEVAIPWSQTSGCVEEDFHARMWDLKREVSLNPISLIITTFHKFLRVCFAYIGYWGLYIYNEPLMMINALMLALVEKPTTTWTWLNMLLMLTKVTRNPLEKGIRQQVHNQKLVRKFYNLLQRTNKTGNDKGVSRTY